ncbi:hypothetical protein KBB68_00895 [Candidatus Babeliales bacterium]|nr:hypothetical protein [Candidatus Babeliales bacterium]
MKLKILIFCLFGYSVFGSAVAATSRVIPNNLNSQKNDLSQFTIPKRNLLLPIIERYQEFFKREELLFLSNSTISKNELLYSVIGASKHPNLPSNKELVELLTQAILQISLPCLKK